MQFFFKNVIFVGAFACCLKNILYLCIHEANQKD